MLVTQISTKLADAIIQSRITGDRQKERQTDRQTCSDKISQIAKQIGLYKKNKSPTMVIKNTVDINYLKELL